jgi:phage antirepressor YoqD-like protein
MLVKSFTDDCWSVQRHDQHLLAGAQPSSANLRCWQQALESEQAASRPKKQLALAAPKVEFVDRYVQPGTGSMGVVRWQSAGAKLNEFTDFLLKRGLMYRTRQRVLTPRADTCITAALRLRQAQQSTAKLHAFNTKFTPKGVEWIAGLWGQHQVRLKQSGGVTA